MKGTRLWQQAGSPLIQGRSRTERSFWVDFWLALFVGLAVGAGVYAALVGSKGSAVALDALSLALPAVVGVIVGSASGVALARVMGWRRRWLTGAALAVALGAVSVWAYLEWLVGSIGK